MTGNFLDYLSLCGLELNYFMCRVRYVLGNLGKVSYITMNVINFQA